jgi:hypothetical protein
VAVCRLQVPHVPWFVLEKAQRNLLRVCADEEKWNLTHKQSIKEHLLCHERIATVHVNARTPDSLIHIDMYLPTLRYQDKPVVIELLDAWHLSGNTRQALGRLLLRQQLLRMHGYHVIALSLKTWDSAANKGAVLRRLLLGCKTGVRSGI